MKCTLNYLSSSLSLLLLTFLFKQTLKYGRIPADWKTVFVSPIFKKGAKNLAVNYRPISLTSILCKLMEKFVRNAILEHLQTRYLLSSKQHGFVTGRSTTTQLLNYLDDIANIISAGSWIFGRHSIRCRTADKNWTRMGFKVIYSTGFKIF